MIACCIAAECQSILAKYARIPLDYHQYINTGSRNINNYLYIYPQLLFSRKSNQLELCVLLIMLTHIFYQYVYIVGSHIQSYIINPHIAVILTIFVLTQSKIITHNRSPNAILSLSKDIIKPKCIFTFTFINKKEISAALLLF